MDIAIAVWKTIITTRQHLPPISSSLALLGRVCLLSAYNETTRRAEQICVSVKTGHAYDIKTQYTTHKCDNYDNSQGYVGMCVSECVCGVFVHVRK